MLPPCGSAKQMAGFPSMNKDLGIVCFVPDPFSKTAMVLVCVRKDDPPNIRKLYPITCQLFPKDLCRLVCFRPNIDQCQRIGFDKVKIYRAYVERCWHRKRYYLNKRKKIAELTNNTIGKENTVLVYPGMSSKPRSAKSSVDNTKGNYIDKKTHICLPKKGF